MGKDMNKRALKALKESIEHWYRISECNTTAELEAEGFEAESCALCLEFDSWEHARYVNGVWMVEDNIRCRGCPVREATGQWGCNGTPYYDASKSLGLWQNSAYRWEDAEWSEQDQANLVAEIRFLEGLLP